MPPKRKIDRNQVGRSPSSCCCSLMVLGAANASTYKQSATYHAYQALYAVYAPKKPRLVYLMMLHVGRLCTEPPLLKKREHTRCLAARWGVRPPVRVVYPCTTCIEYYCCMYKQYQKTVRATETENRPQSSWQEPLLLLL